MERLRPLPPPHTDKWAPQPRQRSLQASQPAATPRRRGGAPSQFRYGRPEPTSPTSISVSGTSSARSKSRAGVPVPMALAWPRKVAQVRHCSLISAIDPRRAQGDARVLLPALTAKRADPHGAPHFGHVSEHELDETRAWEGGRRRPRPLVVVAACPPAGSQARRFVAVRVNQDASSASATQPVDAWARPLFSVVGSAMISRVVAGADDDG
jgi:hypothetical protein